MKIFKLKIFLTVFSLASAAFLFASLPALAAAPSLELSTTNDGDSVQLNVTGQAGKNVIFYYRKAGSNLQLSFLGAIGSQGALSTNLSTAAYGIIPESLVYVMVDGVKSNEKAWPHAAASASLSLSQTSLVLSLGQQATINIYNQGSNYVYLSNNSNPPIANVNIESNQAKIFAINYGATVITLCAQMNSPSCASAYISVQNTNGKPVTFSQNNPSVATGKNVAVSIFGGNGSYTLLNNSNSGTVQASLSGSTVTLSANASSGSSAVTICSSDMTSCGIINATAGAVSSEGMTLSQANPSVITGQTIRLSISGGLGNDYGVSSNSDSAIASAYISNNDLVITGSKAGSTTITVCTSKGTCAAATVTVTSTNTSTGGAISLSQNNLWLMAGQSSSLTISGGAMPYSAAGYSENILKTSITNNILTITGVGAGSASVSVCSAAGGCANLSVLINGTTAANDATPLSLSQTSLAINAGSSGKVLISGNGSYYISYNTNPSAASALISGGTMTVTGLAAGAADFSVCQNNGSCAIVKATVSPALVPAPEPVTPPSSEVIPSSQTQDNQSTEWIPCAKEKEICKFTGYQTVRYGANGKYNYGSYLNGVSCSNAIFDDPLPNVVKSCSYGGVIPETETVTPAQPKVAGEKIVVQLPKYKFTKALSYGASGSAVKELQQRLKAEGFYAGAIDGKYLTSTAGAVKKYQKAKGILQTGNVGPLTMAALNK